jgi:hypothetical protein
MTIENTNHRVFTQVKIAEKNRQAAKLAGRLFEMRFLFSSLTNLSLFNQPMLQGFGDCFRL